ncbi:primosomal replication protein [Duffyella gerundensis]|uniref:primosomal replication protein PriC n=1 Tax=Duffyella gerundensis TaxID=1619313 RepID=UPI0016931A43|nr:primosomal replication protein PriC [Duffyella gerundensis]QTO53359.1 primosomal replication protein [Duffyella gerundensis]
MNRQQLFLEIEKLQQRLTAQAADLKHYKVKRGSFDRQLFTTRSSAPQDYLQEISQHLTQFRDEKDVARAGWLAEKLVNQITALQRQFASQPAVVRAVPAVMPDAIAQHEEFARRLQAMLDQREAQLAQADTLLQQQTLKRELEALEQRLKRCMQALNQLKADLPAR